ncbi:helix-turn-helix domain-containing protein [Bradyrhizobium manausense]|uniref:AraC family transcriptional regulator n=1 Tax=Bradyrhizobium manausense TaxID=989370 RepID=UPI001BABE9D6|nr:helix-turn-helix transcriptional regulator [Bradyrhizobium manausense]MBR1086106.1 helix-turn-helix domain-containing protein [Bradyrhizobium manausense]
MKPRNIAAVLDCERTTPYFFEFVFSKKLSISIETEFMTSRAPQAPRRLLPSADAVDLRFQPSSHSSRAGVKSLLAREDLHVIRCDLSAGTVICRPDGDQSDRRYALVISHGGGLSIARVDTVQKLNSGDAVFLCERETWRIESQAAFRISILSLPVESLNTAAMDFDRLFAQVISRHTEGLVLLRRYLQVIEKDDSAKRSGEASALISRHIRDLLSLALARRPGDFDRNVRLTLLETRLDAVTAYLESGFRNPSMSASEAAAALAISPRYVERLLQSTGTTFNERLIELRLDEAYRQLRDAQLLNRSIETIALSSGFTNASHFTRRFRARFGYPPSEVRRRTTHSEGEAAQQSAEPRARRKSDQPLAVGRSHLDHELSDEVRKASTAGQRALAASALKEAVFQFRMALDNLRRIPPDSERDELELDCQLGIVSALVAQRGYTDPHTAAAYRRAEALCRVLNLEQRLANVEDALFREHLVRADYKEALKICEKAQKGGRDSWLIGAAIVRMHQGKLDIAGGLLDRAIPRRVGHAGSLAALTPTNYFDILGQLVYEALYEVLRAERETSRALVQKAIGIARKSASPASLGFVLSSCVRISWLDGDGERNRLIAQELAELCRNQSFAYWGTVADCHLAWHAGKAGQIDAAIMIENAIERYRRTGARWLLPYLIALQAEIDQMAGQHERAMQRVFEARTLADQLEERWYDAALLGLESDILMSVGRTEEAQRARHESRSLARKQGAHLFLREK